MLSQCQEYLQNGDDNQSIDPEQKGLEQKDLIYR